MVRYAVYAPPVLHFLFLKALGELFMEEKKSNQDMSMKTSEVKIGNTVFLVSTNLHLLTEKSILNKYKRVLSSEVQEKENNS